MARIKISDAQIAEMKTRTTYNQWAARHNEAIDWPKGFETAIVKMLHFWECYAVEHQKRYESPIGDDYVIGDYWLDVAKGIRGLLNGETGRLDCGTLDSFILETLRENGVETDGL